jgi:hypothetical protein
MSSDAPHKHRAATNVGPDALTVAQRVPTIEYVQVLLLRKDFAARHATLMFVGRQVAARATHHTHHLAAVAAPAPAPHVAVDSEACSINS